VLAIVSGTPGNVKKLFFPEPRSVMNSGVVNDPFGVSFSLHFRWGTFPVGKGCKAMTIRGLAAEIYRAIKEVERLEKEREALPVDSPRRQELDDELRKARAERDRLRHWLEGAKAGE
jgi:hypothetical protein